MADRDRMLAAIDAALAARTSGDKEAVAGFFAPDSTFRIAGDRAALGAFPVGPGEAMPTIAELIDRVRFDEVERLDAIVEGNRAACRWRIRFSIDGGEQATTEVCDLWTFDEDGRIVDLVQFIDTAHLERLLANR